MRQEARAESEGWPGGPRRPRRTQCFIAVVPDAVWLTEISEHAAGEGKLYLCAVKDVFSNRIVGYSIASRMKASLEVSALNHAITLRSPTATPVIDTHDVAGEKIRPLILRRIHAAQLRAHTKPALGNATEGERCEAIMGERLFVGLRGGRIQTGVLRAATHWNEVVTKLGYEQRRRHDLRHTGLTRVANPVCSCLGSNRSSARPTPGHPVVPPSGH
jgi:hypothetical protein